MANTTTAASTTRTAEDTSTAYVKLSCNHTGFLGGEVEVGNRVRCIKCDQDGTAITRRTRRVKAILDTIEAKPAPAPVEVTVTEDVADALVSLLVVEPAPAAEAPAAPAEGYDPVLASAEHKALKAWVDGGREGDAPATTNLDAMNAAHAAGKPRTGRKAAGARQPRTVNARRAEANALKATKTRTPVKVTEDELATYVAEVATTEGRGSWNDELEYAYWVKGFAVSRARWNKAVEAFEAK